MAKRKNHGPRHLVKPAQTRGRLLVSPEEEEEDAPPLAANEAPAAAAAEYAAPPGGDARGAPRFMAARALNKSERSPVGRPKVVASTPPTKGEVSSFLGAFHPRERPHLEGVGETGGPHNRGGSDRHVKISGHSWSAF